MKTPYEKLKSVLNASDCLKPGITFELLNAQASMMSDNDAALALNNARKSCLKTSLLQSKSRLDKYQRQGKTKKHLLTRSNQNKVQLLKFKILRSDSFRDWNILCTPSSSACAAYPAAVATPGTNTSLSPQNNNGVSSRCHGGTPC